MGSLLPLLLPSQVESGKATSERVASWRSDCVRSGTSRVRGEASYAEPGFRDTDPRPTCSITRPDYDKRSLTGGEASVTMRMNSVE